MYRVSYIGPNGISHKGNLKTIEEAKVWLDENNKIIIPLKLLVWNEITQCCKTIKDFGNR